MVPSNLMLGKKNTPLNLKMTRALKDFIRQNWDYVKYPETAKMKKGVPFKSEHDFIITIIRKDCLKSKFKFNVDMEVNDPDFYEKNGN
jgi:hypothetical protein